MNDDIILWLQHFEEMLRDEFRDHKEKEQRMRDKKLVYLKLLHKVCEVTHRNQNFQKLLLEATERENKLRAIK